MYGYNVTAHGSYGDSMKSRFGTIDLKTGELQEGTLVWVGLKRSPYGSRWYMSSQDAAIELAKDPVISKSAETMRVFLYLVGRLDFENFIQVPQIEIAQELGMHRQHVHRAINILLKRGVILQGPKVARSYSWRLNDHYGWKGKVSHLKEAQKNRLELVRKTTPDVVSKRYDKT